MNQDNNFNQNNFNSQGNNGISNNHPLPNNQNLNNQFNQSTSVNQPTFNQQPTPQPINTFESGNANNQSFNSKSPKKMNLSLIIGIVVALAVVGVGIVFGSKLLSNGGRDNSIIPSDSNQNNNSSNDKNENEVLTEEEKIEKLKKEYQTNSKVKFSARLGKIEYGYQKLEIDITNNSNKNIKRVDFYVVTYDSNKNQISKGYMASDTILNAGMIKNGEWNLVGENIHSFDLYVWGIQFDDGSIWGEDSLNEDIIIQCALKIL